LIGAFFLISLLFRRPEIGAVVAEFGLECFGEWRENCVMADFLSSDVRTTKTGEDTYHVVVDSRFQQIDEQVDGAKFLGMYEGRSLVDQQGNPITAQAILRQFDASKIGHEIVVTHVERAA
jgi:hypothetical protein